MSKHHWELFLFPFFGLWFVGTPPRSTCLFNRFTLPWHVKTQNFYHTKNLENSNFFYIYQMEEYWGERGEGFFWVLVFSRCSHKVPNDALHVFPNLFPNISTHYLIFIAQIFTLINYIQVTKECGLCHIKSSRPWHICGAKICGFITYNVQHVMFIITYITLKWQFDIR